MTPSFSVTILGSGTSTGVPVVGCCCPVCTSPDLRNRRTRCSALLRWAGRTVLVDTTTDFRQQALREGLSAIDAVLVTHTHADHVNGIDDLRPFSFTADAPIPLYASPAALERLRRSFSYIFCESDDATVYRPRLHPSPLDGPFELFGRTVVPVPLVHGNGDALGYRVGPFAYLTDCNAIPAASASLLQGLEVLVIDALRYRPHATHFNIEQAIDAARRLGVRRTLLTHLGHDVDHARLAAELPEGIEVAYDGLRLEFPDEPPEAGSSLQQRQSTF